ncbi:uncharacterized protein B0P05DRAFT_600605 [Gilbertella persicaria]|uniref:uncharacterized protein n=1 Tax=Gilbertella persicaria TaxID=101096 RepID=UPI00221E9451|nr:uncharacterized protein B0P05DRAFT_600605 [Gilbertella persicaria]KAI8050136.1 hypothetical protein B0P05DRAFT_600605 [Gilbertella persicaria]
MGGKKGFKKRQKLLFSFPFSLSFSLFSKVNKDNKMSAPYDPYIPNKNRNEEGNNKTARVQQQVDEVVGIMQENIDKVMQRGERLDDLRGKTGKVFSDSHHASYSPTQIEDLQATAGHFRRGANQVRKRMWWKDLKWKIIIAVTILVILGIIIGSIVGTQTHSNTTTTTVVTTTAAAPTATGA